MRQGIEITIKDKILKHGPGWCFTAMDFEDLGSNDAIRRVLSLLQKEKWIRRLAQGIYDYPKELEGVGVVPPNLNDVAISIPASLTYLCIVSRSFQPQIFWI